MATEIIPQHLRQAAKQLVEDPAFQAACAGLQAAYFSKWRQAKTAEERERLWIAASQVDDINKELVYLFNHNKIDDVRIDAMAKRGAK